MADYYAKQADKADPFNWIQIHPLLNADAIKRFPFDRASEGETSLMLDLCPEGVDMQLFSTKQWFTRTARQASAGSRWFSMICAAARKRSKPGLIWAGYQSGIPALRNAS